MGAICSNTSSPAKDDPGKFPKPVITRPPFSFIVDKDTPVYSAEHVGGKAYNLLRLNAAGVSNPPFMVVTAEECSEIFLQQEPNFQQRFNLWILDPVKYSIEDVREKIRTATLSTQVTNMVDKYLAENPNNSFAVRSSFNGTDASNSVFAGLFETYLHVTSRDAILSLIVQCSLSCLKDEAAAFYRRSRLRSPRMAVIVMVQLESEVSGVLFQANPITGSRSTCVISASYGQGDGVNGGVVAADEWWINSSSLVIRKRVVENKTHRIGLSTDKEGGILLEDVPEELRNKPCLTDQQIKHVVSVGKKIEKLYNAPQDIEFAFVGEKLSVLQTRPISTFSTSVDWTPPIPTQEWLLYTTVHFPMTPIYGAIWSKVWSEGLMLLSHMMGNIFASAETCVLNGFGYYSLELACKPTSKPWFNKLKLKLLRKQAMENAERFWNEKAYLIPKNTWKVTKQKVKERNRKLSQVKLKEIGDLALLEHFHDCYQNLEFMFGIHISDTTQSMVAVTWFVIWVTLNAEDVSQKDVLSVLSGHSPVTEGIHGEFPQLFGALADHYDEMTNIVKQFGENQAANALEALKQQLPAGIGMQFGAMVEDIEYRLLRGYDTVNQTLKENPKMFLAIIRREVEKARDIKNGKLQKKSGTNGEQVQVDPNSLEGKTLAIRSKLPESLRSQFDDMLQEANEVSKLREERALYTDLTAAGILHHCILEIGHRVARQSPVFGSSTLMLYASYDQVCALLMEHDSAMERAVVAELKQRRVERRMISIRDAPVSLGKEAEDLGMEHFPSPFMAQSYMSTMLALRQLTGVEKDSQQLETRYMKGKSNTLYGIGGSSGIYRGHVVVIGFATDVAKVKPGSVVVTESTSSLINLVLPFAGAIVTDFGALLSHAAICAREAKIPCVLGTKTGTTTLRDGQYVEVDGTVGTVQILKSGESKTAAVFSMLRQPTIGQSDRTAQVIAAATPPASVAGASVTELEIEEVGDEMKPVETSIEQLAPVKVL